MSSPVDCQGCGTHIDDSATACPRCGRPVGGQDDQTKARHRPKRRLLLNAGMVCLIAFVATFSLLMVRGCLYHLFGQ
jgi:uncharacterized membrane protein YvbJ